jgi:hypothetical protein
MVTWELEVLDCGDWDGNAEGERKPGSTRRADNDISLSTDTAGGELLLLRFTT